jgi:hypothetical protein
MDPLEAKILDLYQIARTALAAQPTVPTRYERMIYVKHALQNHHKEMIAHFRCSKDLWNLITATITVH